MIGMMEYDAGYLVTGLDDVLYYVEHAGTVWTVRVAEVDTLPACVVVQEPWCKGMKKEAKP